MQKSIKIDQIDKVKRPERTIQRILEYTNARKLQLGNN